MAANYFKDDLTQRGLAGSGSRSRKYFLGKYGPLRLFKDKFPRLDNFPYYDDAKRIYDALWDCIASLIYCTYGSDEDVRADPELRNFVKEARKSEAEGGAGVQDLPALNGSRAQLIDFVAHIAFLASIKHGVLNTNSPAYGLNTLPYHPMAFYHPLPTTEQEKAAVKDLAPYLPNVMQSLQQVALLAAFARPSYVSNNGEGGRTLLHAFDEPHLLQSWPDTFGRAVKLFKVRMQNLSNDLRQRNSEGGGSAGASASASANAPFAWTALDPNWAPYFAAI